uniref:Uncharacterized protein n=1 Tax=Meloidogyne incognita TaxID=6306 RepID=A0A914LIR8_MELIC
MKDGPRVEKNPRPIVGFSQPFVIAQASQWSRSSDRVLDFFGSDWKKSGFRVTRPIPIIEERGREHFFDSKGVSYK